jgi:hypothetical protein
MGDIFISYSRRDAELVDQFVAALARQGIKAWVDREDIKVGNSWRVQIVEAIDTCDVFVLMLSANSASSTNVHKEVILAQDSARPTYVVMLEVVRLPVEIRYQLAGLQFINLPLLGFDKSADKLIESVKPHLKKITPNGEGAHKQTELVIQGVDFSAFTTEKQEQLLAFISSLANTDPSQLKIANMTAGSVHIFMDMPADTAFQLKTLALNSDPRFRELGIVSLRLNGDNQYVNIATGLLVATATISLFTLLWLKIPSIFSSFLGLVYGKILTILTVLFVVAGACVMYSRPAPTASVTSSPDPIITETSTASSAPEPVSTLTETPTPPELTSTATETSTSTPAPATLLNGVVNADQLSCRYGPGASYLYAYGLINANKVQVLGKAETTAGTWIYVDYGGERPCWVNAKFVQVDGDIADLEQVYPQKAPLILFSHPKFPPVTEVEASREGDQVDITWVGYELAPGDRESTDSPQYLVELWTCQGGQIVFTAYGAFSQGAVITDQAGCAEPSHGQVFIAHKDGYIGPVPIPWPEP